MMELLSDLSKMKKSFQALVRASSMVENMAFPGLVPFIQAIIVCVVSIAIHKNQNFFLRKNTTCDALPESSAEIPLKITPAMRAKFHPVVIFKEEPTILDLTKIAGFSQLVPKEEQEDFIRERRREKAESRCLKSDENGNANPSSNTSMYTIGKYDENRVNLYSSEMFQDEENAIDGFSGARTLHIGIDLGADVGTEVFSFWHGHVHSVGYNADLGDYGYVIVVEYDLSDLISAEDNMRRKQSCKVDGKNKIWALYGHLDSSTIQLNHEGKQIKRGEVLGHLGDVDVNGGWKIPHVHFQLSTEAPDTHDMPGAVAPADRAKALSVYPDPRIILGDIY